MLSEQIGAGRYDVEIQYVRGATWKGNSAALDLLAEVFVPCDAAWRGLGEMAKSGLNLKESYAAVDAARRFDLAVPPAPEPPGCRCAEILRGKARPPDCRLFGAVCTPAHPVGPCMVSSEGTCAAYFKYTPRKD
jgi:hydrogenase expression/formation protein HypD